MATHSNHYRSRPWLSRCVEKTASGHRCVRYARSDLDSNLCLQHFRIVAALVTGGEP